MSEHIYTGSSTPTAPRVLSREEFDTIEFLRDELGAVAAQRDEARAVARRLYERSQLADKWRVMALNHSNRIRSLEAENALLRARLQELES